MNLRRVASPALVMLSVLIVVPDQATADTYIDCDQGAGVCGPDDKVHYWCFGSSYDGYPNMRDAASRAMNQHENDTELTTTQVSSCNQYTDVRFVRANIGSTTAGRYDCVTWAGADHPNRCAAATVTVTGMPSSPQRPTRTFRGPTG